MILTSPSAELVLWVVVYQNDISPDRVAVPGSHSRVEDWLSVVWRLSLAASLLLQSQCCFPVDTDRSTACVSQIKTTGYHFNLDSHMGRICCVSYNEDGSSKFLQHICTHLPKCVASHPSILTTARTSNLVRNSDNTLYSGGAWLGAYLHWGFLPLSLVPPGKCQDSTSIRLRLLPSKSSFISHPNIQDSKC